MKKKNVWIALGLALIMLTASALSPCAPPAKAECMGYDIHAYWDNDVSASVDKRNLEPDPWSQTVTVNYDINIAFVGNYDYDWYIQVTPTTLRKKLNSERVGNRITGSWTIKLSDLVDPQSGRTTPNGDYEFTFYGLGGVEYTYFGNIYKTTVKPDQHYYTDTRFLVADIYSQLSSPKQAAPGDNVTVSWDIAPSNGDAWIGFYKWGEPDSNPLRRVFLSSLSGKQWTVPGMYTGVSPGTYDFRLFKDNSGSYYMNGKTDILFEYNKPTITVDALEVHPGDDFRITWTGGPPYDALGHMDMYHADTLWGAFTAGLDPEGDINYHLHTNASPGFYQVRMYARDDILVGVSNGFAVTPAGSQQSPGGGAGGSAADTGTTGTSSSTGTGASSTGTAVGSTIVLPVGQSTMTVNGATKEIDPGQGTAPVLVNGRVFVPIRSIVETLGGTIGWSAPEQKLTINMGTNTIDLWIGQNNARVGGVSKTLDTAPFVSDTGRTMLPLRFVTENLGCQVSWDAASQQATISSTAGGSSIAPVTTPTATTITDTTTTVIPGTPTGSTSSSSAQAEANDSSLAARYKFNGDFTDASGSGNDGTKVGDVSFIDDSVMGKCVSFNGGYVNVESSPELNLGEKFSVAVWVKVDPSMAIPNNKTGPIISKLDDKEVYNNYIWYTRGTFGIRADMRTNIGEKYNGEKSIQIKPFTDYHLNNWSHLVFSGDGQNLYLYHNGSLISTQAIGSGVSITPSNSDKADMRIGNGNDINNKTLFFMGMMDDLRIYNRTLGAGEIQTLYNGGTPTGN